MKNNTLSPQENAIAELEAIGFECASNFASNPHDETDFSRCYIFTRKVGSYRWQQVQIDPDGSCNGESLADYLASVETDLLRRRAAVV